MLGIQRAIERGAKGVKEPWEEADSSGIVTFAVVQTVSYVCYESVYQSTHSIFVLSGLFVCLSVV